jgi:hypothetical protein
MVRPPFALLRNEFTLNGCFFFFALATNRLASGFR